MSFNKVDNSDSRENPEVGFGAWINESAFLIYDNFDIWKVAIKRRHAPQNITHGFGKKNNINFKLLEKAIDSSEFTGNVKLLLTAFNNINKYSGFYSVSLNGGSDPQLLTMGPYIFNVKNIDRPRNSRIWLVHRMTYDESPNCFLTDDFKKFSAVTNLRLHKSYNWLTAEIIEWTHPDGFVSQVFYINHKTSIPQKYPIIFHYYEKMSNKIYEYPKPAFMEGDINIPYLVNHGYVVFVPDIRYTIGKVSESVFNSVFSAANHIFQLPFIDSSRAALQGHSFGGFETICL